MTDYALIIDHTYKSSLLLLLSCFFRTCVLVDKQNGVPRRSKMPLFSTWHFLTSFFLFLPYFFFIPLYPRRWIFSGKRAPKETAAAGTSPGTRNNHSSATSTGQATASTFRRSFLALYCTATPDLFSLFFSLSLISSHRSPPKKWTSSAAAVFGLNVTKTRANINSRCSSRLFDAKQSWQRTGRQATIVWRC